MDKGGYIMKNVLRYVSIGLGFFFLWASASGFVLPLIMPATFRSDAHQALAAGIMFLPIGFILRFISLHKKSKKVRFLQIINNYFMLIAFVALPGITSIIGIAILSFGIVGYIVSDNILRKRRRLDEDSNIY